jgi:dynein heavy chain, axonemal
LRLIEALGDESTLWMGTASKLNDNYRCILGDSLISAATTVYLGPFTASFRDRVTKTFIHFTKNSDVTTSDDFDVLNVLGDPLEVEKARSQGLPPDRFSETNGLLVWNSRRWPLCIDPQGQAHRWIRNFEEKNRLMIIRQTDDSFVRDVENAIITGTPVLIENMGEEVNSILSPLLGKQIYPKAGTMCIRLGDDEVEFNSNFRLYLTTKLANPCYNPEISSKVCLINFSVTQSGLEDQLLSAVVSKEEPRLEEERSRLLKENRENKEELRRLEDSILEQLSSKKIEDLLDDEELIITLKSSKKSAKEIEEKVKEAAVTEEYIENARGQYKPVARSVSNMFFGLVDLQHVEPTYNYSLQFFVELFYRSIQTSQKVAAVEKRVEIIVAHFRRALYRNICRSLFAKDKLLFSFLLATRAAMLQYDINEEDMRQLLTGTAMPVAGGEDSPVSWVPPPMWAELNVLFQFSFGEALRENFINRLGEWKTFVDGDAVHEPLPGGFDEKITSFQRLLFIRCLRMDLLWPAMEEFVRRTIGDEFTEPPAFDLEEGYMDSDSVTPILFVLSQGADPMHHVCFIVVSFKTAVAFTQ